MGRLSCEAVDQTTQPAPHATGMHACRGSIQEEPPLRMVKPRSCVGLVRRARPAHSGTACAPAPGEKSINRRVAVYTMGAVRGACWTDHRTAVAIAHVTAVQRPRLATPTLRRPAAPLAGNPGGG